MFGAIIGDLAGSIYEYSQIKKVSSVKIDNIIESNSFFSDDTILTVAVADAAMNGKSYNETIRQYFNLYKNYLPDFKPYFKTMFSLNFEKWAMSDVVGESIGNGAMMRISPVGYLFDSEEEVIKNAELATIPSHNTEQAMKYAKIVALIIFYARKGYSKEEIKHKLKLNIKKPTVTRFNLTCEDTIDICLYSLFMSKSFSDSIRLAVSFGGDTDTNACIVGSMAEAMCGIDEKLKQQAVEKLPFEFVKVVEQFYTIVNKK